jgi:hypothetical protein
MPLYNRIGLNVGGFKNRKNSLARDRASPSRASVRRTRNMPYPRRGRTISDLPRRLDSQLVAAVSLAKSLSPRDATSVIPKGMKRRVRIRNTWHLRNTLLLCCANPPITCSRKWTQWPTRLCSQPLKRLYRLRTSQCRLLLG